MTNREYIAANGGNERELLERGLKFYEMGYFTLEYLEYVCEMSYNDILLTTILN